MTRGERSHHARGCHVNGGTKRHGLRGFVCLKCAETYDRTLETLMKRAENRAGKTR